MISNSDSFNVDLTARDNDGKTGFQLAQDEEESEVVNLIKSKMLNIAFQNTLNGQTQNNNNFLQKGIMLESQRFQRHPQISLFC